MPSTFHRKLPHNVPSWVEAGSPFFLTICCEPRDLNQLALPATARGLFSTIEHYQRDLTWFTHLCLLMPDHLHMITGFPQGRPMKEVVTAWKSYNKRFHRVLWEDGFFDRRLRNQDEFDEKASYIRMNPVRAGLVTRAEDWPFVWDAVHGAPMLEEDKKLSGDASSTSAE